MVAYSLLGAPTTLILHDDSHWLSSLRHFLGSLDASLHVKGLELPQPLRDVDVCIMDATHMLPGIKKAQLQAFNRCRIYIGVIYVAEISTADGRNLSCEAWDGSRSRLSPVLWPHQPKPGPKFFRTWRRLLATAFLLSHQARVSYNTRDLTLRRPLGRWLPSSVAFWYHWRAFYAASTNTLFVLSSDDRTFTSHTPRRTRRRPKHPVRAFSDEPTSLVTILPTDSVPVEYTTEPNKFVIPDTLATLSHEQPPTPTAVSWPAYFSTLPLWDRELLSSVVIIDRARLFPALREQAVLHLASDGGAVDNRGSYGALLATEEHILVECGG
jgi:hypothetical protein